VYIRASLLLLGAECYDEIIRRLAGTGCELSGGSGLDVDVLRKGSYAPTYTEH